MEEEIKKNINSPEQLEKLYQTDKKYFKKSFSNIYNDIAKFKITEFWKARLEFYNQKETKLKTLKNNISFVIIACFISGFLIKIPPLFGMIEHLYYKKNAALILVFGLSFYSFFIKNQINIKHLIISIFIFIVSALYINLLPFDINSDSVALAYIHLPLFLWFLYGLIFNNFDVKDKSKIIRFIKYNGDLIILIAIIAISGAILTGITIALFSAIDLEIEKFYFDYIVIPGVVSAPIVATYIINNFPFVTNKIVPIIAKIFTPLVLITLAIYLVSILLTGKDPYNNRDFLIVFNLMLLGVMAIIIFSISEVSKTKREIFNEIILFALLIITLIVDLIALSAIIYRLQEYGFTPNRVAVLVSNILIFGNLVFIMLDLYKVVFKAGNIKKVELTISKYLPIYIIWIVFVIFALPFIFNFK